MHSLDTFYKLLWNNMFVITKHRISYLKIFIFVFSIQMYSVFSMPSKYSFKRITGFVADSIRYLVILIDDHQNESKDSITFHHPTKLKNQTD